MFAAEWPNPTLWVILTGGQVALSLKRAAHMVRGSGGVEGSLGLAKVLLIEARVCFWKEGEGSSKEQTVSSKWRDHTIYSIHCLSFHRTCKSDILLQSFPQTHLSDLHVEAHTNHDARWHYTFLCWQFFEAEAKNMLFSTLTSCLDTHLLSSQFFDIIYSFSWGAREISHPILP